MKPRLSVFVTFLVLAGVVPSFAQTRGFLDVNFTVASPVEKSFTSVGSAVVSQETSTWSFKYDIPARKEVDFAGGAFFTRMLGIGVAVSSGSSTVNPTLTDTEPHPVYFNALATGTLAGTTPQDRTETGVHIQAVFRPETQGRVQVRISGGPSYFSIRQQMVDNFIFSQTYSLFTTANTVAIKSYTSKDVSTTAWGFNVGGDAAYFFNKNIGLGGFARYATASATVPNTAQDLSEPGATQPIKAGGASFGFGMRARF